MQASIIVLPKTISAAEGVYTALTSEALLNVPVPEVVQVEEVAAPPLEPASVVVLPAQMVTLAPALTVAIGLIVSVIAEVAAGQGPAGSSVG